MALAPIVSNEQVEGRTFDDLVQVEDEQDDEKILDMISTCEPISDGRDQRDDDGQVQVRPGATLLRRRDGWRRRGPPVTQQQGPCPWRPVA